MGFTYDTPFPRKLMGHGQGLYDKTDSNDNVRYFPTADTLDVADALGIYWKLHPRRRDLDILLSGGYPDLASFGQMKRPPKGVNEAAFQADRLHNVWGVPRNQMTTEGSSGHTFEGFTIPIERGLLTPGEFTPEAPLILVVRREQILRTSIIARQILAIPDGALYRLWEMTPYEGLLAVREEWLAKLTHLAMDQVQARPGNLEDTQRVFDRFDQLYHNPPDVSEYPLPPLPPIATLPRAA